MRSIDRRIRKLESVANLKESMRQYVDDQGNVRAKPTDPLQVLAWVIGHPRASLELIGQAANQLAQYKYARKREDTHKVDDPAAFVAMVAEVREKFIQAREQVPE